MILSKFLTKIVKYDIINMSRKLAYNKKGIPSFEELGTIPKKFCVSTDLYSWYYFY